MDQAGKNKNRRSYNVFFNAHTVSGIAISVALFVIFLAGTYTLFRNEINHWHKSAKPTAYLVDVDYDQILSIVKQEGFVTKGRDITISYRESIPNYIQVNAEALPFTLSNPEVEISKEDSLASGAISLKIDPNTYQVEALEPVSESDLLGDFLYHLHHFKQIPAIGQYLAGFVAVFFLFTIITGVIIHWKKIVSNFFTFRLKSSVKNLWTDAHTTLGVIGLPFQFMYALTGAFYGLVLVLYIPILFLVFDGDKAKMLSLIELEVPQPKEKIMIPSSDVRVNSLVSMAHDNLKKEKIDFELIRLSDYETDSAVLLVNTLIGSEQHFFNQQTTKYSLSDGVFLGQKPIDEISYYQVTTSLITKFHFAAYGGYLVKAVHFSLALITCFVIISGVMVWITARDKKAYARKSTFNRNVGAIFIGACLGLYPSIALLFCLAKLFPDNFSNAGTVFFLFWILFIIYSYIIKSPFKITKRALLLAGGIGIAVPLTNGLSSGLWFWHSLQDGYPYSFFVDVLWLVASILTLWVASKARPVDKSVKT